jgi:hypothetical protein
MAAQYSDRRTAEMKRVIIICEGPTEQEFCKDVLTPYFFKKDIFIQAPLIKKSGGGIVPWETLKKQIETHLKQEPSAVITMLIDYYGIPGQYNYPGWEEAHKEPDKSVRMEIIENVMHQSISEKWQHRFIPYLQLHEFEGLLFNDVKIFTGNFTEDEFVDFNDFENIFRQFSNPEDINDGANSAPSKRLLHHIKGYNKIVYGAILAAEIGITRIKEKCPRFNHWLEKIKQS